MQYAATNPATTAPGTLVRLTATTSPEPIVGTLVSVTDRGIRIRKTADGKYVTRRASVVTAFEFAVPGTQAEKVEKVPTEIVPLMVAMSQVAQEMVELPAATGDEDNTVHIGEIVAGMKVDAEPVPAQGDAPVVHGEDSASEILAAVRQAATPAPAPATSGATAAADEAVRQAEAGDFDPNPIIDGRPLSTLRFSEVMKLAQKYRTPGRGVARIDALRAGVAKAIALEVAAAITATAAA